MNVKHVDLSVIIVNYNTTAHVINCLNSVIRNTSGIEYEIIVVDNNSPERSIENLHSEYPDVIFQLRNVNDGFGGGCNFGAKYSYGKYLAFINPDNIFMDNSLKILYDFMEKEKDVALCSGLLIDSEGKLKYSYNYFPDISWEFKEAFRIGYSEAIQKLLNRNEINSNIAFDIDWALGALLFVRRELFNLIKGFDDTFFLYSEDNDLQYRLKKLGHKIKCLPYVKVKHSGGSSIEKGDGDKIYDYYFNRSIMLYMYKHFNFFKRNLVRSFFIISNILRIIYCPVNPKQKYKRIYYLKRTFRAIRVYCYFQKSLLLFYGGIR